MTTPLPAWMQIEPTDWDSDQIEELPGYNFYNNTIKIHFDPAAHVYYRFDDEGVRHDIDGVTSVLGVISKPFLIPWATKLCIETLQGHLVNKETGAINSFTTEELMAWMHEAKNKHRERLETAGDIGHIAHDCLEKSIQYAIDHTEGIVLKLYGLPQDETPENVMAINCVLAAWDWMKGHNVRWLATERKIYSKEYNVAGTEDGVCIVDSCSDLKCCRGRLFRDHKAIADWKSSNQLSDSYAYQLAIYQFAQIEEFGEFIPDRWCLRLGKLDGQFEPWYLPSDYFEADLNAFLAALNLYRSLKEITARRSKDKAELRAILKTIKTEAKAAEKAQEQSERKLAREVSKLATKARKEAADVEYKRLRDSGLSPTEAKLIAYPKKEKGEPSEVQTITESKPTEPKQFEVEWVLNL